jgi:hypothetical protein
MASTSIYTRPSSTINWADDDEDDFDFEAWKATADISAPTVDSLPPLQLPHTGEEPLLTVCGAAMVNEAAPWAVEPSQQPTAAKLDPEQFKDWCGKQALAFRAVSDRPAPPAYRSMSTWEGGQICFGQRVNYSHNWGKAKVNSGLNCMFTAQLLPSPLRLVAFAEPEELVAESEEEISAEEVSDTSLSYSEVEGKVDCLDGATPNTTEVDPTSAEEVCCKTEQDVSIAEDATPPKLKLTTTPCNPASSSATTEDASNTMCTPDEGYYSNESSSTSPILDAFKQSTNIIADATQLDILPATILAIARKSNHKHSRTDSMEALKNFCARTKVGTNKDGPLEAFDLTNTSPDGYAKPGIATYLSQAAAIGWSYAASMPWTAAAIVATGVVVGGALHFARRR